MPDDIAEIMESVTKPSKQKGSKKNKNNKANTHSLALAATPGYREKAAAEFAKKTAELKSNVDALGKAVPGRPVACLPGWPAGLAGLAGLAG